MFLDWWLNLLPRFLAWWCDLFRRWLQLRRPVQSPIRGMPLRYLIGADTPRGEAGCVTMVPYGGTRVDVGLTAGYCNAFDETSRYDPETNSGMFEPYRKQSPTARAYGEGVPDQSGDGYRRNIVAQLDLRKLQGIALVEIDNPDAYPLVSVLQAIGWAEERGIQVLAKNPGLSNAWQDDPVEVVRHPNVVGAIVERGAGTSLSMHDLRVRAGRPELPVRFVAFNDGEGGEVWAQAIADDIREEGYRDMGVTYSSAVREYASSIDVIRPVV